MTVPVRCPPSSVPTADVSSVTPQKRRRRAPMSGASDDCFTCMKRHIKCDRRRPYCSQCLEVDNECSGYKTQLTWGVGVASRGKLRGLSLPVVKSAPASKSPITKHPRGATPLSKHADPRDIEASLDAAAAAAAAASAAAAAAAAAAATAATAGDDKVKAEPHVRVPAAGYSAYDFANMAPNSPSSVHSLPVGADWTMSIPQDFVSSPPTSAPAVRPSLQPQFPPYVGPADDLNMGSPSGSMSAYSDTDYSSPDRMFGADDVPLLSGSIPVYNSYSSSPVDHSLAYGLMPEGRAPTSWPDQYYSPSEVSSSLGSHPAALEMGENRPRHTASPHGSDINYDDEISRALSASHGAELYMDSPHVSGVTWVSGVDSGFYSTSGTDRKVPPLFPPPESFHVPLAPDISPRVEFFLNYYDKVICPIVVAVDTPSNPYRQHILSLALESRSLQHAICTLACGHMRMWNRQSQGHPRSPRQPFELEGRTATSGRSELISNVRNTLGVDSSADGMSDEPATQEEFLHRSRAATHLNQQLGDPNTARHDSVLAALLILCFYGICVSGTVQFKTQFAGVQKLLRMRSSGSGSMAKWGWMESVFAFFDAAAATVGDREALLRGEYLDTIASPACSFQNLAGCDASLFKTVASLGRLNLLWQRRPVLDPSCRSPGSPFDRPQSDQSQPRLVTQPLFELYKFHMQNYKTSSLEKSSDDYDAEAAVHVCSPIPTIFSTSNPASPANAVPVDERHLHFWEEWATARQSLQAWEFSATLLTSTLPVPSKHQQTREFSHASEAFRYAALLYLERLASPQLPSSCQSIQHLVTRTLYFINELQGSDLEKFLLWPLFVLGSESVSETQRSVVRTRCRMISQRSGFSNGLAGLQVLERCWGEMDAETASAIDPKRHGPSPFRWSKWMDGPEGEVLMA